jgi:hypothetical protein
VGGTHWPVGPRIETYGVGGKTKEGARMKKTLLLLSMVALIASCASTIHEAVERRDMKRLDAFVEQGDINTFSRKAEYTGGGYSGPAAEDRRKGHTPLMIACYYGYADIARYLCEHGADPDAVNGVGDSALMFAIYYNYPNVVKVLVDHGVTVNRKDPYGHTALYYAERYYHPRIVELLKEAGGIAE